MGGGEGGVGGDLVIDPIFFLPRPPRGASAINGLWRRQPGARKCWGDLYQDGNIKALKTAVGP